MILKIKDRLSLLLILPTEGSLSEMVDIYDLARELKLNDSEKDLVEYSENVNGARWNMKRDPNKDIQLSKDQYKIVMNAIDELDKQHKISLSLIETILKLKGYGEYAESETTHT